MVRAEFATYMPEEVVREVIKHVTLMKSCDGNLSVNEAVSASLKIVLPPNRGKTDVLKSAVLSR